MPSGSEFPNQHMSPGPALSGTLVKSIGFNWMLYGIAIITLLYAPLLIYVRNPPVKLPEKEVCSSGQNDSEIPYSIGFSF